MRKFHHLVECIECVIRLIYVMYVTAVYNLPSAEYYSETRAMTSSSLQTMIANIFAYAWLQILSFVCLHYTVK